MDLRSPGPPNLITIKLADAYEGIKFAVEVLQANKIWVEGDSSVVVHWLKAGEGPGQFCECFIV